MEDERKQEDLNQPSIFDDETNLALEEEAIVGIDRVVGLPGVPTQAINTLSAKDNGYCLVESPLNATQIRALREKTPKQFIKTFPGRGGKALSYVPVALYIRKLNFLFGYGNWDFEITKSDIIEDNAIVQGKLVIFNQLTNRQFTMSQFGGHPVAREVEYTNGTTTIDGYTYKKLPEAEKAACSKRKGAPVDTGDTLKAAATDAFKKCCSMFGMFADVYAPADFAELREKQQASYAPETSKSDEIKADKKAKVLADIKTRLAAIKTEAERKRTKAQVIENLKKADPGLWTDEDFKAV